MATEEKSADVTTNTTKQEPQDAEKKNGEVGETPSSNSLKGEALHQALVKQVEYYFSRENLAKDAYLLSQMNSEMYVPVSTLASFGKVKALTTEIDEVKAALSTSTILTLDETGTMVKPVLKLERTTLILREIPTSTPTEEVRGLFKPEYVLSSIKGEVGDCWYVTFEDESNTKKALEFVRTQTFNGNPVKARIKTESLLRGFFYANSDGSPQVVQPGPFYGQTVFVPRQNWAPMGRGGGYPPYGWEQGSHEQPYALGRHYNEKDRNRNYRKQRGMGRRGGHRENEGGNKRKKTGQRKRGGNSQADKQGEKKQGANVPLGPSHFPPLPRTEEEAEGGAVPAAPAAPQAEKSSEAQGWLAVVSTPAAFTTPAPAQKPVVAKQTQEHPQEKRSRGKGQTAASVLKGGHGEGGRRGSKEGSKSNSESGKKQVNNKQRGTGGGKESNKSSGSSNSSNNNNKRENNTEKKAATNEQPQQAQQKKEATQSPSSTSAEKKQSPPMSKDGRPLWSQIVGNKPSSSSPPSSSPSPSENPTSASPPSPSSSSSEGSNKEPSPPSPSTSSSTKKDSSPPSSPPTSSPAGSDKTSPAQTQEGEKEKAPGKKAAEK